jgi:hypothetical protein
MIRKRLSSTTRSESASPAPQRRRISRIPSPSIPQDERNLSDDDLRAELRDSYLTEQARVRDAIRREIGDNLPAIVRESVTNMSAGYRRRVLSLFKRRLAGR